MPTSQTIDSTKMSASVNHDSLSPQTINYGSKNFIEQVSGHILLKVMEWHHYIEHNDIQHNDILHNDTEYKRIKIVTFRKKNFLRNLLFGVVSCRVSY